jgi:hypothetical protein
LKPLVSKWTLVLYVWTWVGRGHSWLDIGCVLTPLVSKWTLVLHVWTWVVYGHKWCGHVNELINATVLRVVPKYTDCEWTHGTHVHGGENGW